VGGVLALVVAASTPAAAQTATAPGPWVLDVRGATSSVPGDLTFYPTQTASVVPARGFGVDLGAHVYPLRVGPAQLGLGANIVFIRSAATDPGSGEETDPAQRLTLTLRAIAPQISFNFGSRDGWSYLSAGLGTASITTRVEGDEAGERATGRRRSINFGGGARWFITERLAFSFDLRAHRIAAGGGTPGTSAFAVGAGVSLR
jgi:hypothetical protein